MPTRAPEWAKAIAQPGQEFGPVELQVSSGTLPPQLQGSLYRNGPGRLQRGGQRVNHWFDGDGAILAVHFREGKARSLYRYVQTQGYQQESEAGRFLWGGYGMTPPGPLWTRWGKPPKNAANTSVLALQDRLLTLWEAGRPHRLDLDTLQTLGLDDLAPQTPYSAHPKRDPASGEIYNFGVSFGVSATLNLYRSNAGGELLQQRQIPLPGFPFVHDFVLAGPYLIFCIPPLQLQLWPVLLQIQSYSNSLQWLPDQPTRLLIVDRQTLQPLRWGEADPWFQWHFCNGFLDPQGKIVLDLIQYPDFKSNQFLGEVPTGELHTAAPGVLKRLLLEPKSAAVIASTTLVAESCEFPTLQPQYTGSCHPMTYLNLHSSSHQVGQELFTTVGVYDHGREQLIKAELGDGYYPSEVIFAPNPDQPDQGWLLSVVFEAQKNLSSVWIWDAHHLPEGPVGVLDLPVPLPFSFHGTWSTGA
jgi:carotenoid cleavage dioxygenase-like enzyme